MARWTPWARAQEGTVTVVGEEAPQARLGSSVHEEGAGSPSPWGSCASASSELSHVPEGPALSPGLCIGRS